MSEFYVAVGDATSFSKTVGEYDVFAFAGISGDFAPNHVNRAYMQKSGYKDLIAHGALLVGYMSTASTQMALASRMDASVTGVSLGYDRMRFLAPVYFGDTITVDYRIVAIDPEKLRATADIRITNQDGTLVAVAQHLLKWVRNDRAG
jgi:3-hydroxybutyryl-CoA dehydratase